MLHDVSSTLGGSGAAVDANGQPIGAKLIQYQSDPIEAFKEMNLKKIVSEEKYSNSDVSSYTTSILSEQY